MMRFIVVLFAIMLTGCDDSLRSDNIRSLDDDEINILKFCGKWHKTEYAENDFVIIPDISLCEGSSKWGCYISFGIIVISQDLDNAGIWKRVKRKDGTEAIRGLVVAHEITHYLRDSESLDVDNKHKSSWFNEDSCILAVRDEST